MIDLLGLVAIMIISFMILASVDRYLQSRAERLRIQHGLVGDDDE